MSEKYTIRTASHDDFEALQQLMVELDKKHIEQHHVFRSDFSIKRYVGLLNRALAEKDYLIIIAESEKQVIGFMLGKVLDISNHALYKDHKIGQIQYAIVKDSLRFKGIGLKLYLDMEKRLNEKKVDVIEFRTFGFSKDIKEESYKKMGFKVKYTVYEKYR